MTSAPIHDYDANGNATYRQDFWENANRAYEDKVERIAIERLLNPAKGKRLLELGAGFGRLSDFYQGYEQVIVLDYAKSQLEDARSRLGDGKYIYVAANIYKLPIAPGTCDAATMIRVLHHFADVPAAFSQIRQALSDGGLFLLEYANKRNLKAMLRFALGRQAWSPYDYDPVEFVKLHFDFHPAYIDAQLQAVDFQLQERLPVSYLRLGLLKATIPAGVLATLDGWLQRTSLLYAPSIFTRNVLPGQRPDTLPETIFHCPTCQNTDLETKPAKLVCTQCGDAWSIANGIYDFREPLK